MLLSPSVGCQISKYGSVENDWYSRENRVSTLTVLGQYYTRSILVSEMPIARGSLKRKATFKRAG